jgi:3-deoxy-manno-octulosonate cytidylyltransferase (CMP-KDO synthetase)
MTLRCIGIIPARLSATRLPRKPLADILGKTLLQRVWEQAQQAAGLCEVHIATDTEELAAVARGFGASVIMTGSDNLTGSDRVGEAAQILASRGVAYDLIANVQGDMPFINPVVITETVNALAHAPLHIGMSTVVTPIDSRDEFLKPSAVKALLGALHDSHQEVLYFSRAPIPFMRDPDEVVVTAEAPYGYRHLGLYVFRPETLQKMRTLPQSLPEKREKLEQLRALSHGVRICAYVASPELLRRQIEVDTPEDLIRAREIAALGA